MMNNYYVETYSESLRKKGEELCGDMVNVIMKTGRDDSRIGRRYG